MATRKLKITRVAIFIFVLDFSLAGVGGRLEGVPEVRGLPVTRRRRRLPARCWLLGLGMRLKSQVPGFGGSIHPPGERAFGLRGRQYRERRPLTLSPACVESRGDQERRQQRQGRVRCGVQAQIQ